MASWRGSHRLRRQTLFAARAQRSSCARGAASAVPQEQSPEGLTVSLRLLRPNTKGRTIGRVPDVWGWSAGSVTPERLSTSAISGTSPVVLERVVR